MALIPVEYFRKLVRRSGDFQRWRGRLQFHYLDLSVFRACFTHFCSPFFSFQPGLPHHFPYLLHALPCYRDLPDHIKIRYKYHHWRPDCQGREPDHFVYVPRPIASPNSTRYPRVFCPLQGKSGNNCNIWTQINGFALLSLSQCETRLVKSTRI